MERKWTLDARVSNQNNFFCILERVDGVNGESQWIRTIKAGQSSDRTAYRSRHGTNY